MFNNNKSFDFWLPAKMEEVRVALFNKLYYYYYISGGRASGKTYGMCLIISLLGYFYKIRVAFVREFWSNLEDSVYTELRAAMQQLGLFATFYKVNQNINTIRGLNGTEFVFKGLQDHAAGKAKGLAKFDISFIDEAQYITKKSWDIYEKSIRGGDWHNEGMLIYCGNPEDPMAPFWVNQDPKNHKPLTKVWQVNWNDNDMCPGRLQDQALWSFENDREWYEHEWGGLPIMRTDDIVYKKVREENYDHEIVKERPYVGVDFGYEHPTVILIMYALNVQGENILYIQDGISIRHKDAGQLPDLFDPFLEKIGRYPVVCDSANPELYKAIGRLKNLNTRKVTKTPKFQIERIQWANKYTIAVNPLLGEKYRALGHKEQKEQNDIYYMLKTFRYEREKMTDEIKFNTPDRKKDDEADALGYGIEDLINTLKRQDFGVPGTIKTFD